MPGSFRRRKIRGLSDFFASNSPLSHRSVLLTLVSTSLSAGWLLAFLNSPLSSFSLSFQGILTSVSRWTVHSSLKLFAILFFFFADKPAIQFFLSGFSYLVFLSDCIITDFRRNYNMAASPKFRKRHCSEQRIFAFFLENA